MSDAPKLGFVPLSAPPKGVLVVFCDDGLKFGQATRKALGPAGELVERAAAADRFTGKSGTALDLVAPAGLDLPRVIVIGAGKVSDLKSQAVVKLGGAAKGRIPTGAAEATIFADLPSGAMKADQA